MNKRTQRILIAVIVFAVAELLFTGIDFIVNSTLYSNGLQYSDSWFLPYSILYSALFQVMILTMVFYTKSWRFLLVAEAFTLSGGQDLIFFGVWNGGVFPVGSWDWLAVCRWFGVEWTTPMQVVTVFASVAVALFIVLLSKSKRQLRLP